MNFLCASLHRIGQVALALFVTAGLAACVDPHKGVINQETIAKGVSKALGPNEAAAILGLSFNSREAMRAFTLDWVKDDDQLTYLTKEDTFPVNTARFPRKFCIDTACTYRNKEYILVQVKPGDYFLQSIHVGKKTYWQEHRETGGLYVPEWDHRFSNMEERDINPDTLKFTINSGQILYIGDYDIKPTFKGYKGKVYPKVWVSLAPVQQYKLENVTFDEAGIPDSIRNFIPKSKNIETVRPINLDKLPLYTFEQCNFCGFKYWY